MPEEPRSPRPGASASDPVRRAGGPTRLAFAVLLVTVSPLVEGVEPDDLRRFGLIVAFGWIPVAALFANLVRQRPGWPSDLALVGVDLVLLGLVQLLLAPNLLFVLSALIVMVAASTYLRGRLLGGLAGAVGVSMLAGISVGQGNLAPQLDGFTAVVYLGLLLVVAFLFDAVAAGRWKADAGLTRLHEKSDAILTGVGEAVVVTGPRGRVGQWNRAASDTFGCDAEAARGRSCADVLGLLHEVRELDCSGGCALLAGDGASASSVEVEVWRRSPTGTRQPLLASVSPVLDQAGRVVEVVHSFRDITRLKQADEAKTLFLATASHELKTPLTVIRGFAQMLLLPDAMVGAERVAALQAIDVRAGQLSAIVDRLLMSSRIESGRIELSPSEVDIAPIIRERADALEGVTARELIVDLPEDLPHPWCDIDAFTTALDHLLDNAVKYSPAGGPITVSAVADRDGVEVSVTDEGVGMTLEQAAHCFDRFWQAEATDVRRFGGTGIGLYIVKSLVDGMGGSIHVTSAPGVGSTFRVRLGLAPKEQAPARGEQTMIREYMRQLGLHLAPDAAAAGRPGVST